jgi:hypothetical protein
VLPDFSSHMLAYPFQPLAWQTIGTFAMAIVTSSQHCQILLFNIEGQLSHDMVILNSLNKLLSHP